MEPFPFIEVSGTYADVGRAIGLRMSSEINKAVLAHKAKVPDYVTHLKKSLEYYSHTQSVFPQYITELESLAQAANVSPQEYFFCNNPEAFDTEEFEDAKENKLPDHCTTVVSKNTSGAIIGHNEDWDISAMSSLYLLKATVNETTFFSLNYSADIPGSAVGINNYGLIQCINYLNSHSSFGIPKNFLARAIMECQSLDAAEKLLTNTQAGSGYNHVLIQNQSVSDIEVSNIGSLIDHVSSQTYVHTNHYLSPLSNAEKFRSPSSLHRYNRANELAKPAMDFNDMAKLLSDKVDNEYPICRPNETLASIIFDTSSSTIRIAKGHPCQNPYTEYSFAKV